MQRQPNNAHADRPHHPRHATARHTARVFATGAMTVAGGFWLWFAAAVLTSEASAGAAWTPLLMFVVPVALLTALTWLAPRVAGLLLVPAALFAGMFFDHTTPRLLLALPLLLTGAALVWSGPWVAGWMGRAVRAGQPGGAVAA